MAFNPRGTYSADLSLFGSRITDIQPSDLPSGVSPDNENVWFQPGMTTTRPKFSRILPIQLTAYDTLSMSEFVAPDGSLPTFIIDSAGRILYDDPDNPTVYVQVGQTVPGMRTKYANAFEKLWMAQYSPAESAPFSKSPFVGAGVPLYYNGKTVQRVTSDAPGITPTFTNVPTVKQALAGAAASGSLTISAAVTSDPKTVYIPPVPLGGGRFIPGKSITTWNQIIYTATGAVPANWLGQSETVTGITGGSASFFNASGTIIAISGSTFTIAATTTVFQQVTGASGTATIGTGTYMQRLSNIVTVWIGGATLPSYFQPGYWASTLNSGGGLINGPNWTITSISRDATGLVTVTVSTQLQNLPVGTELFLTPAMTAFSGTVSVTNGDPTVSWVSGSTFIDDMVGQAITINSVVYTVAAVASPTSLILASNVTSTTGTYSYSASITAFPTGLQTVFQVTNTTSTSTTFTYESNDTSIATATGGTVYQQWSPQLGTNGNEAQIISAGIDANSGAYFTFFQLGPDTSIAAGQGNISSPYSQIQGQIPSGLRNVVVTFQSGDGAETAPSPIQQIAVQGGSNLLQASNIPLGPPNTVQRNLAFTPYNGSSWYELAPAVLPAIGNSGETIVLGTQILDNTTTSTTIDFSDSQLTSGEQVDVPGNDLFNQIVLPPCLGVLEYQQRLFWWGAINNVRNMINLGFDGGYTPVTGSVNVINGSTAVSYVTGPKFIAGSIWAGSTIFLGGVAYTISFVPSSTSLTLSTAYTGTTGTVSSSVINVNGTPPLGWTLGGTNPPFLVSSKFSPGFAVDMPVGSTLAQTVYQDEFGAPILLPSTLYGVRILAGSASAGQIFAQLVSTSLGILASASMSVPAATTAKPFDWSYGIFTVPTLPSIPADLTIVFSNPFSPTDVIIDEAQVIFAQQPVQNKTALASYIADPFGYDDITGNLSYDVEESMTAMFQQRGYVYVISDESLFKSQDNQQSEPSGWSIVKYAAACGCSGPNAVDASEDIAWWTGRYGGRLFNGNPATKKMTQEIASDWENHNWDLQTLDWVANDPVQRIVYCGFVQEGESQVSAILPMNYRMADDAYNVPDPVHVSTYSGKMIATDLGRKWSLWTPGMNHAAMCTRDTATGFARQMLFAGSGFSNLYSLDTVNFPGFEDTDDDYGVIGSYYTTYFFPDHLTEQNPLVQSYRKFFGYFGVHATGKGQLVLTPYVDSLSTPWPGFPAFNLTGPDTGFDYQVALNVRGDRMAMKISTQALDGTPGGAFVLTHVIFSCQVDRSFPVRGSIL